MAAAPEAGLMATPRLSIDLRVPLDDFPLAVRWETGALALGLFGPSGAGKTTLLESLAGLRPGATGRIEVGGRVWMDTAQGARLAPQERGVGYVPQDLLLFPHRDVMGNLMAGRRRASRAAAAIPPDRVLDVLELRGLTDRSVASLSGGEKQRVALGRALCSAPDLLLLDEPLAGLDAPLRRRAVSLLRRVQEEFGIPTVHVSHDALEMRLLCSEILVLSRGEVAACGDPESVFRMPGLWPEAARGGFENLLHGHVEATTESTAVVRVGSRAVVAAPLADLRPGNKVMLGIASSALVVSVEPPAGLSAQNILRGRVVSLEEEHTVGEPEGEQLVEVLPEGWERALVVALTRRAVTSLRLAPGSSAHLIFKTHALRVLASW
jgi:molybdate transport system ATP-binding protein